MFTHPRFANEWREGIMQIARSLLLPAMQFAQNAALRKPTLEPLTSGRVEWQRARGVERGGTVQAEPEEHGTCRSNYGTRQDPGLVFPTKSYRPPYPSRSALLHPAGWKA